MTTRDDYLFTVLKIEILFEENFWQLDSKHSSPSFLDNFVEVDHKILRSCFFLNHIPITEKIISSTCKFFSREFGQSHNKAKLRAGFFCPYFLNLLLKASYVVGFPKNSFSWQIVLLLKKIQKFSAFIQFCTFFRHFFVRIAVFSI